jgi:hypothetical protein
VISKTTPSFWHALSLIAAVDREGARRVYRIFAKNPDHNSLRFKKLAGHVDLWSVRVSRRVRTVGQRSGDTITWVWIGSHNEFDKLFG